jgi:hypothetical protein
LGPESFFAAAALAGIAHTAGLAGTIAAAVVDIPSSQGRNFHHLPDVFADQLLAATPHSGCPAADVGSTVTPATTGRARSLPGWHILVADILVSFTSILLNYSLFSGNRQIIHLDLLDPVARSHTSGTSSAGMWG